MAGLVQKLKDIWNPPEDEYDVYDYEEDFADEVLENSEEQFEEKKAKRKENSNNKVVNLHGNSKVHVVLYKPERFGEETRTIADEFLKVHTIVLNLENANKDASRRIIDFLSGVAYAHGGKIKRVATDTFVITPYNVDLTGDDLLDGLRSDGIYF